MDLRDFGNIVLHIILVGYLAMNYSLLRGLATLEKKGDERFALGDERFDNVERNLRHLGDVILIVKSIHEREHSSLHDQVRDLSDNHMRMLDLIEKVFKMVQVHESKMKSIESRNGKKQTFQY